MANYLPTLMGNSYNGLTIYCYDSDMLISTKTACHMLPTNYAGHTKLYVVRCYAVYTLFVIWITVYLHKRKQIKYNLPQNKRLSECPQACRKRDFQCKSKSKMIAACSLRRAISARQAYLQSVWQMRAQHLHHTQAHQFRLSAFIMSAMLRHSTGSRTFISTYKLNWYMCVCFFIAANMMILLWQSLLSLVFCHLSAALLFSVCCYCLLSTLSFVINIHCSLSLFAVIVDISCGRAVDFVLTLLRCGVRFVVAAIFCH